MEKLHETMSSFDHVILKSTDHEIRVSVYVMIDVYDLCPSPMTTEIYRRGIDVFDPKIPFLGVKLLDDGRILIERWDLTMRREGPVLEHLFTQTSEILIDLSVHLEILRQRLIQLTEDSSADEPQDEHPQ